jgi:hypothetical protein
VRPQTEVNDKMFKLYTYLSDVSQKLCQIIKMDAVIYYAYNNRYNSLHIVCKGK